ncbi:MAG: tetratricopeptide repeat protein, partial [Candidatus Thorarchaeota archaeon]
VLAIEEGRPDDAIEILEPIIDEAYDEAEALLYLGIAYVQDEQAEKAAEVLERAQELVEEHCVLSMFLGRALMILGKLEDAEEELRRSVRLDPNHAEPWADLGKVLYKKREYGEIIKTLEGAIERFPDNLDIRAMYAFGLYKLGDYTLAAEQWGSLHRLEPQLMSAVSNYAFLMLTLGRTYEAAPFVGQAQMMAPADYRSLILLGELRFQSGEHEGARECFCEVLEQDNDSVEALARLAVLFHYVQDEHASEEHLRRAEFLVSDDPEMWRGLCYAYSMLGRADEFIDCLIKWAQADPTSAAPWVALAKQYDEVGLLEHSRNAWRVAFELRNYVKILCGQCGYEQRLPYSEQDGFDFYADRICPECKALIRMPSGLPAL